MTPGVRVEIAAEFLGEQETPEQRITGNIAVCNGLHRDFKTSGGAFHIHGIFMWAA